MTMKVSQEYPSRYLKAADLKNRNVTVVISKVEKEDILGQGNDKDRKVVLSFEGRDKVFVQNKTNASILAKSYGDDMGNWIGKKVELMCTQTQFNGQLVACIRVRAVIDGEESLDDDINF